MDEIKETLIIKPCAAIDRLTVRTLRVLKILKRKLGDDSGFVYYGEIADELHLEWNQVKSSVRSLVEAEVVSKQNKELSIIKDVIL